MSPLSLSGDQYRELVEHAPILIWRSDLSGGCDYFNARWLAFTGRAVEREFGDGWAEGVHREDLNRCLGTYLRAFRRREPFEIEYRLRRHDGLYRWLLDRGAPYADARGEFAGYIGSCIDVTEAVEAREAIRLAHQAELRRLQHLLPVCAGCKKIRDEEGSWHDVEAYLGEKTGSGLTHTLCPECLEVRYPESIRPPAAAAGAE